MIIIPLMQEVTIDVILFIAALVTSMRGRSVADVPRLPKGMAKFIVNISFCFTCFCCCVCCSQHCRAKTLGVLVLFSFMTITFRGVMTVISVGFILFIDAFRTNAITITALFSSLVIFTVVFVFLINILFKSWQKCCNEPTSSQLLWKHNYYNCVYCSNAPDCAVYDHILLPESDRVQGNSDWTDTIHCYLCSHMVHQEETENRSETNTHHH